MAHVLHSDEPIDDDLNFDDEYHLVCPNCGSYDYNYVGEAYDDEEYLGSSYDCLDCAHRFTMDDSIES